MKQVTILLFLFVSVLAFPQNPAVSHRKNAECEHAAPPPGMNWVCPNLGTCDCHLEGKARDGDEDGQISTLDQAAPPVKVCQHAAPPVGSVLSCDANCKCDVKAANPAATGHAISSNCDQAAVSGKNKKKRIRKTTKETSK